MARKKTNNTIEAFKIFFASIKTYFMYLDQTVKALVFPVFAQLLSIITILTITYLMCTNAEKIENNFPALASSSGFLTALYILLIPFFIIFIKAFYDYVILFSSLNLVFYTNSGKKKIKNLDFDSYNNSIKRRIIKYVVLMLLSVPFLIIAPFLALVFQIFAMENDVSPMRAITRSIKMVKDNFIPIIIMLLLCFFVTYSFLPSLFIWTSQKISLYYFMLNICEKFLTIVPIETYISQIDLGILNDGINEIFSTVSIAKFMVESTIAYLIIAFTLPFRCCCFTELYRLYDAKHIKENSKMTDEIVRRATSRK